MIRIIHENKIHTQQEVALNDLKPGWHAKINPLRDMGNRIQAYQVALRQVAPERREGVMTLDLKGKVILSHHSLKSLKPLSTLEGKALLEAWLAPSA